MKNKNLLILVMFFVEISFAKAGFPISNDSYKEFCMRTSVNEDKKASAIRSLATLRKGDSMYDIYINEILKLSRDGNFCLSDIGTSRKELRELRVLGCKVGASIWLEELRRKDRTDFDSALSTFHEKLADGNLTLEDVGTSVFEIEQIKKSTHTRAAKSIIQKLRKDPKLYKQYFVDLRRNISGSNLSLEEFGISESELAEIRRVAYSQQQK